jgi:hypothetical protein
MNAFTEKDMRRVFVSCSRLLSAPTARSRARAQIGRVLAWIVVSATCASAFAQPGSASLANSTYLTTANTGAINPTHFTLEARIQPPGPGYGQTQTLPGAAIITKPRQDVSGQRLESWSLWWSPVTQRVAFSVTHVFGTSGSTVGN